MSHTANLQNPFSNYDSSRSDRHTTSNRGCLTYKISSLFDRCPTQLVSAMNAFPPGTRVFFWTSDGEVEYAIVQSTNRLPDGTQILVVKIEVKNKIATLPAAGVTKVT